MLNRKAVYPKDQSRFQPDYVDKRDHVDRSDIIVINDENRGLIGVNEYSCHELELYFGVNQRPIPFQRNTLLVLCRTEDGSPICIGLNLDLYTEGMLTTFDIPE